MDPDLSVATHTEACGARSDCPVGLVQVVDSLTAGWRDDAECKGRTMLFFPRRAERPEARQRRESQAEKLCTRCPVREPCREFARNNREYGYWAGESEEQRHLLGFTVSAPIGIRTRFPSQAV